MARRRVSQVELAATLGLAQSSLSLRLRTNSWPAADLPAVAHFLDVDVAELYEGIAAHRPRPHGSAPAHLDNVPASCSCSWAENGVTGCWDLTRRDPRCAEHGDGQAAGETGRGAA